MIDSGCLNDLYDHLRYCYIIKAIFKKLFSELEKFSVSTANDLANVKSIFYLLPHFCQSILINFC